MNTKKCQQLNLRKRAHNNSNSNKDHLSNALCAFHWHVWSTYSAAFSLPVLYHTSDLEDWEWVKWVKIRCLWVSCPKTWRSQCIWSGSQALSAISLPPSFILDIYAAVDLKQLVAALFVHILQISSSTYSPACTEFWLMKSSGLEFNQENKWNSREWRKPERPAP